MSKKRTRQKRTRRSTHRRRSFTESTLAILRSNWPLMKVYLLFGAVLLVLFTIIIIPPIYDRVVEPLNVFLASSSAEVISLLGNENVVSEGKSVSTAGFAINIAEGCNGIYALSIILAGILAFPSGWRAKLLGVMIATVFIMFLNYVRILTLWYAGMSSSFLFDAMHLYVWEFIIIALGAGLWYFWYERYAQKH